MTSALRGNDGLPFLAGVGGVAEGFEARHLVTVIRQHAADNIYRAFLPTRTSPNYRATEPPSDRAPNYRTTELPSYRATDPRASDLPCHALLVDSSHRGRNTVFREREGRRMTRPSAARFDGSLARQFDFGDLDIPLRAAALATGSKPLRLAARPAGLRGPDKYRCSTTGGGRRKSRPAGCWICAEPVNVFF